jgi:hypothetical protein
VPVGRERMWGKDVGGWIWHKYCIYIYVNGKMRPVESIPGMGVDGTKGNDWGGEFKYDIVDIL